MMGADFFVSRCYDVSGIGLVIAGWVESGEIKEGFIGTTAKGKRFSLVRIEKEGRQVPVAQEKDKVNLFVKHIVRTDMKSGETIHLGDTLRFD